MNPTLKFFCFVLVCFNFPLSSLAQNCSIPSVDFVADIPSVCGKMTMTMLHDQRGEDYLYIAHKSGGLTVVDINQSESPIEISNVPFDKLDSLDVISLSQEDAFLYLALGNIFNDNQFSGMAIIDIQNPNDPKVMDVWSNETYTGGSGIVKVQGNYAYLGAMQNGLIILDISNKNDVQFVSQFVPEISYPDPNPDPAKYNARGMAVKDDLLYLCYDAGGLRILDISNKSAPKEIGRYSNPELNRLPRAYNNLILDGDLVYIAVDYCGLEVLNISNPAQIELVGWWNPWNCQGNPLNWFSSPGHTNEIAYNPDCKTIFMSTGKSDMYAVDISDPTQPDSCFSFGGIENNIGTWGVSTFENQIYLSYICTFIPFTSNWTGVKILNYNNTCVNATTELKEDQPKVFPNPVEDQLTIALKNQHNIQIVIYDVSGRVVLVKALKDVEDFPTSSVGIGQIHQINLAHLNNGIYYLKMEVDGKVYREKILKW